MSKILITGNGFDLFHHLPTKYGHFMSVMKTVEKSEFTKKVTFEELFGADFKNEYLTDHNLILDNYDTNKIKFDGTKIKELDVLLKNNNWYSYFKTVLEIDTWIDFEIELEYILNQLPFLNTFKNKVDFEKNKFLDSNVRFNDFEKFKIIKIENKNGLFTLNEQYINKRKKSLDIKKITEHLTLSFEEFIDIFNIYLFNVVNLFNSFKQHPKEIFLNLIDEIYTFNYTPTLEQFYDIEKSKIVYLHGEIHEDCKFQNLVFGISEINQELKLAKAYDFTKYYQKIIKNSNKKFIEIPIVKSTGMNEKIFYILGHSLDVSDKEYIFDLFKYLEYDLSAHSKICVFYHSIYDKEQKLKNLLNIIDNKFLIEMSKSDRLYFVLLNVENINQEFKKELYKIPDPTFFF